MKKFFTTHSSFVSTIVIGMLLSSFVPGVHAQNAPSTYSAYTGTDMKTIPPAPALGVANSVIKDPTFGAQIFRVTDANTNAIKLSGPHGDGYWLDFNPNTFTGGDGSSKPVIHSVPFGATWEWSAI